MLIRERILEILRMVFDRYPARVVDSLLLIWQDHNDKRLLAKTYDGPGLLDRPPGVCGCL